MEESIINIVNSVGFPIVCVLYLIKAHREEAQIQREEGAEMRKAIQELTIMINKLSERLINHEQE